MCVYIYIYTYVCIICRWESLGICWIKLQCLSERCMKVSLGMDWMEKMLQFSTKKNNVNYLHIKIMKGYILWLYSMIIYYNYLRNLESKIIPLLPPTSWGAFGCQNQYYVNQTVLHMGPQDKAKNQQTCCEEWIYTSLKPWWTLLWQATWANLSI